MAKIKEMIYYLFSLSFFKTPIRICEGDLQAPCAMERNLTSSWCSEIWLEPTSAWHPMTRWVRDWTSPTLGPAARGKAWPGTWGGSATTGPLVVSHQTLHSSADQELTNFLWGNHYLYFRCFHLFYFSQLVLSLKFARLFCCIISVELVWGLWSAYGYFPSPSTFSSQLKI